MFESCLKPCSVHPFPIKVKLPVLHDPAAATEKHRKRRLIRPHSEPRGGTGWMLIQLIVRCLRDIGQAPLRTGSRFDCPSCKSNNRREIT